MTEQTSALGPIGYLVVEFPKAKVTGEGMQELVDLVDRGLIRILDLAFVMSRADGTVSIADLSDVDGDGQFDMMLFDGVSSGLLDPDDVAQSGAILQPGAAAAILLYENRWATRFVDAIRRNGGELVTAGIVPQDALESALDAMESRVN